MRKLLISILVGIITFSLGITPVNAISKLHADGRYIKDEAGNIIFLRGVLRSQLISAVGMWQPEGQGPSSGYTTWNESAVRLHMQQLKDYNMNVMRWLLNIEWWQKDMNTSLDGRSTDRYYRESIKDAVEIAQEYGIYIILNMYMVRVGPQPNGPYPPYSNPGDEAIIPSEDAFVQFWVDFAQEMKGYPNVIYEVFNEPVGMPASEWFSVVQGVIDAIRAIGDDHIILAQYAYSGGFEIPLFLSLNDSAGNIGYANHIYRFPPGATMGLGTPAYTYDDVKKQLTERWNYDEAVATNIFIVITELGPWTVEAWNQTQELTYYENILTILNEWNISYTGSHWDHPWVNFRLQNFNGTTAPFPPNQYGQILINAITPPITGRLIDKNNNPVQANITAYQQGTINVVNSKQTNLTGDYKVPLSPGKYDIQFDILSIPNFFIKLLSINLYSKLQDIINLITSSDSKVSFTVDMKDSQTIQTYSPQKPARVLIAGIPITEVSSYSQLTNNTWYYDSTGNKLYMIVSTTTCSDGTPYGQCSVTKPLYCDNGNLIDKCSLCGCLSGYECQVNETCIATGVTRTFGKTAIGDSAGTSYAGYAYANEYVLSENGSVSQISFYIQAQSGTANVKTAIYNVADGNPDALLGESASVEVSTTLKWWDFTFSPPVSLTAGVYAFAWVQSAHINNRYDTGDVGQYNGDVSTYPNFPNPYTTNATFAQAYSVYATYTPT